MSETHSVTAWLLQLSSSDRAKHNEAAAVIYKRYEAALTSEIRNRIKPGLQRKFDEQDLFQTVMRQFFKRSETVPVDSRGDFWRLILDIAFKRIASKVRRELTQGRDYTREKFLNSVAADGDDSPALELPAPGIDVEREAREVAEEVQLMLAELPDDRRRAVELLKAGYSQKESAEALKVTTRTVERWIRGIRESWQGKV